MISPSRWLFLCQASGPVWRRFRRPAKMTTRQLTTMTTASRTSRRRVAQIILWQRQETLPWACLTQVVMVRLPAVVQLDPLRRCQVPVKVLQANLCRPRPRMRWHHLLLGHQPPAAQQTVLLLHGSQVETAPAVKDPRQLCVQSAWNNHLHLLFPINSRRPNNPPRPPPLHHQSVLSLGEEMIEIVEKKESPRQETVSWSQDVAGMYPASNIKTKDPLLLKLKPNLVQLPIQLTCLIQIS